MARLQSPWRSPELKIRRAGSSVSSHVGPPRWAAPPQIRSRGTQDFPRNSFGPPSSDCRLYLVGVAALAIGRRRSFGARATSIRRLHEPGGANREHPLAAAAGVLVAPHSPVPRSEGAFLTLKLKARRCCRRRWAASRIRRECRSAPRRRSGSPSPSPAGCTPACSSRLP